MCASNILVIAIILTVTVSAFHGSRGCSSSRLVGPVRRDKVRILKLGGATEGKGDDLEAQVALLEKERLESFLEKKTRVWEGTWEILKRKAQVPSERYSATEVVHLIMSSMRESDSPQLDHGPAVILSFAFENGALANSKMDPSGLGSFLRGRYDSLLDWRRYEIVDTQKVTSAVDNDLLERCAITVKVSGWGSLLGSLSADGATDDDGVYEFSMVRANKKWLVDVIVKRS